MLASDSYNLSAMLANIGDFRLRFGNELNAQMAGTTATMRLNDPLMYALNQGLIEPFPYLQGFAPQDDGKTIYDRIEELFRQWTPLGQAYQLGEDLRKQQDAAAAQSGTGWTLRDTGISVVLVIIGLLLLAGGILSFV